MGRSHGPFCTIPGLSYYMDEDAIYGAKEQKRRTCRAILGLRSQ